MMLGRRAEVLPVECVVRGYLAGSGWKEYRATGTICGVRCPAGLRESDRLPAADLHPGHQGRAGRARREHRLRGDDRALESIAGPDAASSATASARSRSPCTRAAPPSASGPGSSSPTPSSSSGSCRSGDLILIDEVMTPDSSRFWDAADYEPGRAQASFDKQFVRDWLERQPWDKTAPGPELPDDVVAGTRARYVEAFERITGRQLRPLPRGGRHRPMSDARIRFAVNVTPKPGILDPQGRAVERSLAHLGIDGRQRRSGWAAGSSSRSTPPTRPRARRRRAAGAASCCRTR